LMTQNGAPLDFDKIVMCTLAIQIVRQARSTMPASTGFAAQSSYAGVIES